MTKEKEEEFFKAYPIAYREYKEIREGKEEKEKRMSIVGLVISLCLMIWQWAKNGFIVALITLTISIVASLVVIALITTSKKWNYYKMQLLPEKIRALIEENDNTPLFKTGKIRLKDYENELSQNLLADIHQSVKQYCPICGAELPDEAKCCPMCGKEI